MQYMRYFRRAAGFTLIEILIVILIVSLMMGLAIPHFMADDNRLARREALRFVNIVKHLADEASFKGANYQVRLDLQKQSYSCLQLRGKEYKPLHNPLLRAHTIDTRNLILKWRPFDDKIIGENMAGEPVKIDIGPFGIQEPFLLIFQVRNSKIGYSAVFMPGQRAPRLFAKPVNWNDLEAKI